MKSGVRLTHIGGPTMLIEVAGWRLLIRDSLHRPQLGVPLEV